MMDSNSTQKPPGKENDLLLPPHIIPRPRYELVLTGDQDRFQIEHDSTRGYAWNMETAWQSFQQAIIAIIVTAVCVGIIIWGFEAEKHRRKANEGSS